MFSINVLTRKFTRLVALSFTLPIAATGGSASASSSVVQPFSFGNREIHYTDNAEIKASTKTFMAAQLPAGLSRAQAVARLTRADMDCGRTTASNTINCTYWASFQDKWTITMKLDDRGAISTASVDHEHIGVDPNE